MRIAALGDSRGNPIAAFVTNRMRPARAVSVPEEQPEFLRHRRGDASHWWDERDDLPARRALRDDGVVP
jgi:hypothetical protein